MIQLSYSDLLDIIVEYRKDISECNTCNIAAVAQDIWDQYRQKEEKPRRLPEYYEPEWDNPLVL